MPPPPNVAWINMALPELGLKVAKRQVLADEVTDDIRAAILSRQLEPGQKLAEDELALQTGVSRGPIREALAHLEREGLVMMERHTRGHALLPGP